MLPQPEDKLPETRLFYTGTLQAMTGSFRARIWDEPPPDVVEELSLERVPRVGRVAYLERMMVRPSLRGRLLFAGMLWHGYPMLVREGVDVCFISCMPGLARYYVRMGARPYGARLIEGGASMALPLMILLHDVAYLRRVGSFMAPQAHRYGRPFDPATRTWSRAGSAASPPTGLPSARREERGPHRAARQLASRAARPTSRRRSQTRRPHSPGRRASPCCRRR